MQQITRRKQSASRRAPRQRTRDDLSSVVDWIIAKRDGKALAPEHIERLVAEFMADRVTDYQMSAWLMAVYFRGMSLDETVALTRAMLRSGQQLAHRHTALPKVDKHSTGGVGDKISLCLAPLVAAAGCAVPMISGRGLGHTGGTLDKLEAIPGYQTRISRARFEQIVRRIGVSIMGQTAELAPADARMYALRDVTGTVPSMPLIAGSILSKKLAAGLDALVMDVKVGSGAFMPDLRSARGLAALLSEVGQALELPVTGLITDMSSPIGAMIGNALEAREAILVLTGGGPHDTRELTLALGVEMLRAGGIERDRGEARLRLERALESGAGAERLERMIALHGGDPAVVSDVSKLPRARIVVPVPAPHTGYVREIEPRRLGELAVAMGAGRTRADQAVDPRVGIELCTERGAHIHRGEPLALLHLARRAASAAFVERAVSGFEIADQKPRARPRVIEALGERERSGRRGTRA